MISIDWQSILAYLLLGVSGIGGIGWGVKAAWPKIKALKPKPSGEVTRAADEPAPPGAVEWAVDICEAMGTAPDSSKLAALLAGSTRDHARALRIAELEAKP
jgi:hypothetical protein